ncbi:septum formation initiator family protein [Hyphomonas sp.]|uniref:FtsB family cell division protein n=1 Tax=Hyphomonas sp. TaxID=87 RepID=UPI003526E8B9
MTSRLEALGLCLVILYFAYHAFAGEKGLGRWTDAQIELQDRKAELAKINTEIEHLRGDIRRVTRGSEDRDYMEALAREKLAFVYPDEIILLASDSTSAK